MRQTDNTALIERGSSKTGGAGSKTAVSKTAVGKTAIGKTVIGKTAIGKTVIGKTAASRPAKSMSVEEIYERILTAITEHRLQPGTQLIEDKLAKIFDVSRTKIREATVRLVHDRIAINIPNRGAFVASPSADDAREIFAARRLIEPELMRLAARHATPKQVAMLRAHVAKETAARGKVDYSIIPLSGEFHLLVAEMAGNSFLTRTLRDLESITCLIIILYDTHGAQGCPYDDHSGLVDAIEAHDEKRAAKLMLEHLDHIEGSLNLAPTPDRRVALEDAFR